MKRLPKPGGVEQALEVPKVTPTLNHTQGREFNTDPRPGPEIHRAAGSRGTAN